MASIAPKLHYGKLTLNGSDMVYNRWVADIPAGIEADEVLAPAFWTHHASSFRPEDLIEARAEDGTWRLYLRVRYVEGTEVHVKREGEVIVYDDDAEPLVDEVYEVKWISPPVQWGVRNKQTKEVLKDRMTKPQAEAYMRGLVKTAAA